MNICAGVSQGGNEPLGVLQRHVPKRGKRAALRDPETKGMDQAAAAAAAATTASCGWTS